MDAMQPFAHVCRDKEEKDMSFHSFTVSFEAPDIIKRMSFDLSFRKIDFRDAIITL